MPNPFGRSASAAGSTSAPNSGAGLASSATPSLNFASARNDLSDAMAGRITLAMLDLIVLALVGFYVYTKSAQGGA